MPTRQKLLCSIAVLLLFGCHSESSRQLAVLREGAKYYEGYLSGDTNTARKSLQGAIEFFQSPRADILNPSGRAGIMYFNYARLYALEKRVGNATGAEKALAEARSWNLKRYQSGTNAFNAQEYRLFDTPQKMIEVADKLDKAGSHGKGPNYLKQTRVDTSGAGSQR